MSTDREKIENQFEELKKHTLQLLDEIDKHVSEAEDLRNARREAEEKAWASEEEMKEKNNAISEKDQKIQRLENDLQESQSKIERANEELEQTKADYEKAKQDADSVLSEKDEAVDAIRKERDELRAEMDQINNQLERVSALYREASAEKAKMAEKVDVSDLLAIYIMLIETIFGGKPHARILYTLHDTKAAITRKNLEASTGIMPAVIKKAIYDLRNENLVSYDEETEEVKLTKEIL
ncbi:MAG: hypothetical protein ACFFED_11335 [Candidatus Thorarchaeota archaeon]